MTRFIMLAVLTASMMVSGCSSTINSKQHLAKVEPLFSTVTGQGLDRCLDDPMVLIAITSPDDPMPVKAEEAINRTDRNDRKEAENLSQFKARTACRDLIMEFRKYGLYKFDAATDGNKVTSIARWKRNEIIDALIAVSNDKCSEYSAHLKTFDGQTNSSFSIASILLGGAGSVVTGADAARILSGGSAVVSGSRAALNDSWFSNQTIHVLVAAFEKARQTQRGDIKNRQACPISSYTINQGLGDAMRYHASCSLLSGLAETAMAVARSDQPGLETMRRQLADLTAIRQQADQFINASLPIESVETRVALQDRNGAHQRLIKAKGDRDAKLRRLESLKSAASDGSPNDEAIGKAQTALAEAEGIVATAQAEADKSDTALRSAIAKDQSVADTRRATLATLTSSAKETSVCPYGPDTTDLKTEVDPVHAPAVGPPPVKKRATKKPTVKKKRR